MQKRILRSRLDETCRACGSAPATLGHILSKCAFHEFGLMKERHDRALYQVVRAILRALELPVQGHYKPRGGVARPGVLGTERKCVKVDQVCPTDRALTACRPDVVVRLEAERRLVILEVVCACEPIVLSRELEKRQKYQDLAADLSRQNPGYTVYDAPVVMGDLGTVGRLRRHLRESQLLDSKQVNRLTKEDQREVICCGVKIMKRHFIL